MKILVTGVKGQLGFDVCRVLDNRGIENKGVDIGDFDLTDKRAVFDAVNEYKPDAVIHCAAFTSVDKAEQERDMCTAVNVDGTRNIADACKAVGAKMMYISTDYVFDGKGDSAFETTDKKSPQNVYGITKSLGEDAVMAALDKHFIVRISWVFGINGHNFVKTMIRLGQTRESVNVVCDQIGSPTYTADLAEVLCDMIATDKYGIYHVTNEGLCSWAQFAEAIMEYAKLDCKVIPVSSDEYPSAVTRPLNSRLSKRSLDENGFSRLPHWQDALKRYIDLLLKQS